MEVPAWRNHLLLLLLLVKLPEQQHLFWGAHGMGQALCGYGCLMGEWEEPLVLFQHVSASGHGVVNRACRRPSH